LERFDSYPISEKTADFSIVSSTFNGELTSVNGGYPYTPEMDFNGYDSFDSSASDGELESSVGTVTIAVQPVNDPPRVIIDLREYVRFGNPITFDASRSFDESPNLSYEWFENGISLGVGDRITLDGLSLGVHEIQVRVTDADGLSSDAFRSFKVVARPPAKIIVSQVRGHTAKINKTASFNVRLGRKPLSDVVIPIHSSDPSEGSLRFDRLVFSPENWSIPQTVGVLGQNEFRNYDSQDYFVVLDPALSDDASYHLLDADDVHMRGVVLDLTSNTQGPIWVTEGKRLIHPLNITNTSEHPIEIELLDGPVSMVVSGGAIFWTPPVGSAGESYFSRIRVTLKSSLIQSLSQFPEFSDMLVLADLEATLDVEIRVAPAEELFTDADGQALTITEPFSSLNGVRYRFPSGQASTRTIKRINSTYLRPVRESITRLTDIAYFVARETEEMQVLVPLSLLDDRLDASLINMFVLNRFEMKPLFWEKLRSKRRSIETIDGAEYLSFFVVGGFSEEHFIGFQKRPLPAPRNSTFQGFGTKVQR